MLYLSGKLYFTIYGCVSPSLKEPRYDPNMATRRLMTAEQFDQLPNAECRRYELIDGELIEMASTNLEHSIVLR